MDKYRDYKNVYCEITNNIKLYGGVSQINYPSSSSLHKIKNFLGFPSKNVVVKGDKLQRLLGKEVENEKKYKEYKDKKFLKDYHDGIIPSPFDILVPYTKEYEKQYTDEWLDKQPISNEMKRKILDEDNKKRVEANQTPFLNEEERSIKFLKDYRNGIISAPFDILVQYTEEYEEQYIGWLDEKYISRGAKKITIDEDNTKRKAAKQQPFDNFKFLTDEEQALIMALKDFE